MQISINTEADTFESALQAVHAAYGKPQQVVVPEEDGAEQPVSEESDFLPGRWTRRKLRRLAEWVQGSDAEAALRFIASHAPAVDLAETFAFMAEHTGAPEFDGKAMGGRMSSIGHARNHIGGGVGAPYDTDYSTRKYRMDKRLADALLEEMDALG